MSLEMRATVARATRAVIPLWPLSSFIAVNPLGARESEVFSTAAPIRPRDAFLEDYEIGRIRDADLASALLNHCPELVGMGEVVLGSRIWGAAELAAAELIHLDRGWVSSPTPPSVPDLVDDIVARWVGAYLDPHPIWEMPGRGDGLWAAWSSMARYDPHLSAAARKRLIDLPNAADAALSQAIARLGIDQGGTEPALRLEAQRLPGWVAHIKWRSDHVGDIDLTSYLAIRMTLRWALGLPHPKAARTPAVDSVSSFERAAALLVILSQDETPSDTVARVARILALHPPHFHASTWQSAYEDHYRRQLLAGIGATVAGTSNPGVQVVMCIDPRSEGLRRHLEADETIETFGFAGFFGVPIRFGHYRARGSIDALPALLTARHSVTEVTNDPRAARHRISALRVRDAFAAALHASETAPASPFALAETLGWFYGAGALVRTLWPRLADAADRQLDRTVPDIATQVTTADAFTLDERAAFAETAIRMMGVDRFAPLVILAGHGSTSTNNLYQSALDCGACGGNPGSANARAAAAIFNDPEVRDKLANRGLKIPAGTHFVAAEHNTVSDQMKILDQYSIPQSHIGAVAQFLDSQTRAADLLVAERASVLPGARGHSVAQLRRRALDWAEVYPELGLVGNAAMIIGPRELTRGVDLQRRVFLHSYGPELDPDGVALETIMTAPLVVAQWINHQYYFSTVDKSRWGAGTKTIHNAVGTLGVLAGQTGDLKLGLPLQSVAVGDRDLHEPMRLSVLIQAPLHRIGTIISRNQVLRHLFDNNWITLTARDDRHGPWYRYGTYGWTRVPGPTTQDKETNDE